MPYPELNPTNKHDILITKPLPPPGSKLLPELGFSNTTSLFQALEEPVPKPKSVCTVYSYPDSPDYPAPLSRALIILGVADDSLSLVRKVVANDEVPDCLHRCTIAVKLADEAHIGQLPPDKVHNSKVFAKLMRQLRSENAVAIVGKDKHGRFGILAPMGTEQSDHYIADDFAADCYVGDVQEVMEFLTTRGGAVAAAPEPAPWETVGASTAQDTSNTWTAPDDDDDGPKWQPDDAGGGFGGFESGTDNGASGGGFSAPWESGGSAAADTSVSAAPAPAPWESNDNPWDTSNNNGTDAAPWETADSGESNKRTFEEMNEENDDNEGEKFHADAGAAAADAFYSGLTRSLDTRADSYLYHMRAFNGWVKATQIQELDPKIIENGRARPKGPLRVLDLACGKGGDLGKWVLHSRGIANYVGSDVARGSLKDAALRARRMRNKLSRCTFTCADLGSDVPGRRRSSKHKQLQKLLTWSLQNESEYESGEPDFKMLRGGGISETDRFDVVSIQFAIHYMMQTRQRARRFFHTVSQLLEIGGNLIATTIDARVIIAHMLDLGLNLHFDKEEPHFSEAVVQAGAGACRITFQPEIVKKIFGTKSDGSNAEEDLFGLEYTFTLVEGSDHSKGVGDAVNLPEWLIPIPVLESLGREAGLELEYGLNFHEFYEQRKVAADHPAAHLALYNMKVLNRNGSISEDEWSISRLYAAVKFKKVRESTVNLDKEEAGVQQDDEESEDEANDEPQPVELDPIKAKTMLPMAMMKAKRAAGADQWNTLSSEEKKKLTQIELEKLAAK